MKIAILHYHLKPGGVTTVIRQQVEALFRHCDTLVVCGEKPIHPFPGKVAVVPGIAYDAPARPLLSPEQVARDVNHAIRRTWPGGCDLIHVHNPLLAKNKNFLNILSILSDMHIPLFLQVHDFAEDGRPHMRYPDPEYPATCHYGVINGRDYDILQSAGRDSKGLHMIPNMINPFRAGETNLIPEKFVVYPVRAIRRKNIGEAILISAFFRENTRLAITLGPNSPIDYPIYDGWKKFCTTHRLPVVFEASRRYDFNSLVLSAQAMITTSISEGFGFAFLESWTAGKGLLGRRLDLCSDFEKKGICLDHLYKRIQIPEEWIDAPGFLKKWRHCFKTAGLQNGISFSTHDINEAFKSVTGNKMIDFSLLDEPEQIHVIEKTSSDPANMHRLLDANPFLANLLNIRKKSRRIDANKAIILQEYNKDSYATRLMEIYEQVRTVSVEQRIDRERIARAFIKPDGFSLLKWGTYGVS